MAWKDDELCVGSLKTATASVLVTTNNSNIHKKSRPLGNAGIDGDFSLKISTQPAIQRILTCCVTDQPKQVISVEF